MVVLVIIQLSMLHVRLRDQDKILKHHFYNSGRIHRIPYPDHQFSLLKRSVKQVVEHDF